MARFSKGTLFALRNDININLLITAILQIPNATIGHILRFRCPICDSYDNTATKLDTNLARCFSCRRNFNTIELVMAVKHYDFTHAVLFLIPHISSDSVASNRLQRPLSSASIVPKPYVGEESQMPKPISTALSKTPYLEANCDNTLKKELTTRGRIEIQKMKAILQEK